MPSELLAASQRRRRLSRSLGDRLKAACREASTGEGCGWPVDGTLGTNGREREEGRFLQLSCIFMWEAKKEPPSLCIRKHGCKANSRFKSLRTLVPHTLKASAQHRNRWLMFAGRLLCARRGLHAPRSLVISSLQPGGGRYHSINSFH